VYWGQALGDKGAKDVASELAQNTHISRLVLQGNKIGNDGLDALCHLLQENPIQTFHFMSQRPDQDSESSRLSDFTLDIDPMFVLLTSANCTVTDVNLSKNSIGDQGMAKIAEALKSNKTLTKLDLRECEISAVGVVALYDALRSPTTCLQYVHLDGNRLTSNHHDQQLLDRIDKQLSSNMLSSYLRQIQDNDPRLEVIDLNRINLGDQGVVPVVEACRQNTFAKELLLRITKITDVGVTRLADVLRHNCTLTHVDLYGNKIGDASAEALMSSLTSNYGLRRLNLQNTDISDIGGRAILAGLRQNSTLTQLDLISTRVSRGIKFRLESMTRLNQLLVELQTDEPTKSISLKAQKIDDLRVSSLCRALHGNSTVTSLQLAQNEIAAEGATTIAELLKKNCVPLHELVLMRNRIGARGAEELASMLRSNTTLAKLNVGLNNIGDQGASALMQALPFNSHLVSINLWSNGITRFGAESIGNVLRQSKQCSQLTSLNMWQNLICPAGAELLRQAMRTNFTLLQFQLEGNPVCDDDDPDTIEILESINDYVYENELLSQLWHGDPLLRAFDLSGREPAVGDVFVDRLALALTDKGPEHSSLNKLILRQNAIGPAGAASLCYLLQNNNTVTKLDLKQNNIGDEGAEFLLQGLAKKYVFTNFVFI